MSGSAYSQSSEIRPTPSVSASVDLTDELHAFAAMRLIPSPEPAPMPGDDCETETSTDGEEPDDEDAGDYLRREPSYQDDDNSSCDYDDDDHGTNMRPLITPPRTGRSASSNGSSSGSGPSVSSSGSSASGDSSSDSDSSDDESSDDSEITPYIIEGDSLLVRPGQYVACPRGHAWFAKKRERISADSCTKCKRIMDLDAPLAHQSGVARVLRRDGFKSASDSLRRGSDGILWDIVCPRNHVTRMSTGDIIRDGAKSQPVCRVCRFVAGYNVRTMLASPDDLREALKHFSCRLIGVIDNDYPGTIYLACDKCGADLIWDGKELANAMAGRNRTPAHVCCAAYSDTARKIEIPYIAPAPKRRCVVQ